MFDITEFDDFGISHAMEAGSGHITASWSSERDHGCDDAFLSLLDQQFSTSLDDDRDSARVEIEDGIDFLQLDHLDFLVDDKIGSEDILASESNETDMTVNVVFPGSITANPQTASVSEYVQPGTVASVGQCPEKSGISSTRARLNKPGEFVFSLGPKKRYLF